MIMTTVKVAVGSHVGGYEPACLPGIFYNMKVYLSNGCNIICLKTWFIFVLPCRGNHFPALFPKQYMSVSMVCKE